MAGNRRGYSRERHTRLKVGVTVLALAAFAAGWFQLSANHAPLPARADAAVGGEDPALTPTPASTATPSPTPPPIAGTTVVQPTTTGGATSTSTRPPASSIPTLPPATPAPATPAPATATPAPSSVQPTPTRKPRTSRGS